MHGRTLSLVTAVRNRTENLRISTASISSCVNHHEHIIVDWGSSPPLSSTDLPADSRIQIVRPVGCHPWWLTQAYNLGFALAKGEFILKIDADVILSSEFLSRIEAHFERADYSCSRLTLQDWSLPSEMYATTGLFWATREALSRVMGFNAFIFGWGWDDIDLYSRLFLAGYRPLHLDHRGTSSLQHADSLRASQVHLRLFNLFSLVIDPSTTKQLTNLINRTIALSCIARSVPMIPLEHYRDPYESGQPLPRPVPSLSILANDDVESLTRSLALMVSANCKLSIPLRVLKSCFRDLYYRELAMSMYDHYIRRRYVSIFS